MLLTGAKIVDCRDRALRALGDLPPFSPILNRLLTTLAQEDVSIAHVSDLIEKDTVVAGNVLRLVNSALYGRRATISSVRHAVTVLGINKLRNAVLGMSITRLWNDVRTPPGWSMARFNMHSVATALLFDLLAQRLPVPYPEGAFVAGLLHDVGRLLMALGLREEYARILELYKLGKRTILQCEQEIAGITHPELSVAVLTAWNLPVPIRSVVECHHRPETVLYAADQYVNSTGTTILDELSSADAPDPNALQSLGLEDLLPFLLQEFQSEFDQISPFFRPA